jgi:hypothetical protein
MKSKKVKHSLRQTVNQYNSIIVQQYNSSTVKQ